MAKLSDVIISNPHIITFDDLARAVGLLGEQGERFLEFDIKPDYRDTPKNWEIKLETAFYWGERVKK
ncbi:MAG TPA: sulfur relay protein DsrC [Hyphomicrobiales bacterium]|nr:sulfur relay protein DsrC [Kaistiaceae bacterium]HQF30747.1 sulfur relay protein DsrC [Hyphomicrobiales bacterium]